jgi:hypothetical protein
MAETLKSFGDGVQRVMDHTKSIDHHMTHTAVSVGNIVKSLFGYALIQKGLESLMHNSTWGKRLALSLDAAKMSATELYRQQHAAQRAYDDANASRQARFQSGELSIKQAAAEKVELRHQLNLLTAQLKFKGQLQQIGKAELVLSGAFLASVTSAYKVFTDTGRILVESNSTLGDRLQLTRSILNTSRLLGTEMQQSMEAARDLVDYGYDLDANFESTLKLVMQMKDGLGLSTKLGAELAVVYERQLRGSARDVADSMARLVNDTSVAADEAGRLAINIGRAVGLLRPGVSADLGAVTELVGRYEGALKRLGGQFGGFEQLLTKITTPEGMLQAGVLGVNNPEFIRSKEATKQVINSFADYAKGFLGNTEGWERALRVQSLAEMFGTTAQQVNLMIRAVEEANQQRQTTITVEQRYKDQVFASAEVFNRLKNSLVALAQQAVLPLIELATSVLKPMADWLSKIQEIPGIVTTAAVVMAGGAVLAVTQIYRLSAALYTMATAAHMSALAVREKAAADIAAAFIGPKMPGAAGGASMMARMSSTIGRFMGVAAAPIIAGAVALAAGAAIGLYIRSKYGDGVEYKQVALKESTSDIVERTLRRAALANDVTGVQMAADRALKAYLKEGFDLKGATAKVANQVADLDRVVGEARFTKASAQHSLGNDPGFDNTMSRLEDTQRELVNIAVKQHQVAVESKAVQKETEKRELEFQFQQRMDQMINKANSVPRWQDVYNPKK